MRNAISCAIGALLLMAVAAPAAAARDKFSWGFITADDERLLVYGVPESDIITLSFICDTKKKSVEVVTTVLPPRMKAGRAGKIKLSTASASLEYAGTTGGTPDMGFHLAATTPIDGKIFDLLEKGTTVSIEALGKKDSVTLSGIKKPLAQMRQECR